MQAIPIRDHLVREHPMYFYPPQPESTPGWTRATLQPLPRGSFRYINGPMGYVYPTSADPNSQFTTKMGQWYSQSRGFWYGRNGPGDPAGFQFPPDGTYAYQGIVCKLPPPSSATAPGRCTGPSGT